jgi:hypothetical protein
MLDPSDMEVQSKITKAVSKCINANVEDNLCVYIPADIVSDHNDELEVKAATLEEVHQWAEPADASLLWQMPKICESTSDYFKSTMSDLCNQYRSIFTEFSILDDV